MKKKLEWYAININTNTGRPELINVLNESTVEFTLKKLKRHKEPLTFNIVKEELSNTFIHDYWSRTEYEMLVSGLFDENSTKIDVWYQLEPNIDKITNYFIIMNKIKIG